jgi:DNA-binding Lrp family transcriptional regulator
MAYVLDEVDNRIIYELDANCRIPETRLAKMVGKSKESVRYRIRRLREEGIITGFATLVDMTRVGFKAHKLYLQTREKPKLMDSFISHLHTRDDVFWLGLGDGAWNVGLTFLAKSSAEFFNEKNELFSRFRDLVLEESVCTVVEAHLIGKKFLANDYAPITASRILGATEKNRIDRKDFEILNCLILDGGMSYVGIGSKIRLPPDTVRNKVREMERSGIISRHAVSIDYQKMGYEYYKTFLHFEGLVKKEDKRLFDIALKHPNVVNYVKVLAPWDIELEIMARNYHSYNEIINYFKEEFSDTLVKVETTVQEIDEVYPSRKIPEETDF